MKLASVSAPMGTRRVKNSLVDQWTKRGSRSRQSHDHRTAWAYLLGAVCPARDEGAALVLPHADTEATQVHLQENTCTVASGTRGIVVMDNAGWHTTPALKV